MLTCICTMFYHVYWNYFRSKRWVINSKREDLMTKDSVYLYTNCRLCSEHFIDSQFMNSGNRNKLIWNAVPTKFSFKPHHERKPPKDRVMSTQTETASPVFVPEIPVLVINIILKLISIVYIQMLFNLGLIQIISVQNI